MPSKTILVGKGALLVTNEDFLNGYQAGHLTYMTEGRSIQHSDESLTKLVLEKLESLDYSSLYGVGFTVGWIVTLASKGPMQQEGGQG